MLQVSMTGHKYDAEEKRMIRIDRERKTENSLATFNIKYYRYSMLDLINDDEYPDVVINRYKIKWMKFNIYVYFGKEPVDGGSSNLNEETLIYDP